MTVRGILGRVTADCACRAGSTRKYCRWHDFSEERQATAWPVRRRPICRGTNRARGVSQARPNRIWVAALLGDGMYFVRLRVRASHRIDLPSEGSVFQFLGREATAKSEDSAPHKIDENWIIFRSEGFDLESSARSYGEDLATFLLIFGLESNLAFDIGGDCATLQFSEAVREAMEAVHENTRIAASTHGVSVHAEQFEWSFLRLHATATVTSPPKALFEAAAVSSPALPKRKSPIFGSILLLNAAKLARSNLAKIVLAVSAIERLGQTTPLSDAEKKLLSHASDAVLKATIGSQTERERVAEGIRRIPSPLSLRAGVIQLLKAVGREDLKKAWESRYDFRSKVVHGSDVRRDPELATEATEILNLCVEIVLCCYRNGTLH